MRLKSKILAGALIALGSAMLNVNVDGAKADTGLCVGATQIASVDGVRDHAVLFGPHSIPVSSSCNYTPSVATLMQICYEWSPKAIYASGAGLRPKLYNGDVVQVGISGGNLIAVSSPSYGDMGKTFMYHPCTFVGGENRPVVTPPVIPPVVITNPPTQIGNGQPMTGRGSSSSGSPMTMSGSGVIIKNVDSTTASGMQ